jgi:hypothetical protein
MQEHPIAAPPPDCFRQEELEAFQTFESQVLQTLRYYLWRSGGSAGALLYALELCFADGAALLLSGGEDSEAIAILDPESLVETARKLQALHGQAVIERMSADAQPLWAGALGQALQGIRLSRHENGLYRNDALLLDFGEKRILLRLGEREGLELSEF